MLEPAKRTGKPAARRRSSKLLGLTLILLSLALALPAFALTSIGEGWFKQSSQSSADLRAVAFPSATHGWAVGAGDVAGGHAKGECRAGRDQHEREERMHLRPDDNRHERDDRDGNDGQWHVIRPFSAR